MGKFNKPVRKGNIARNATIAGLATTIILSFTALAAWLTSVIHCISNEKYILLIADILLGPIGVIHGVGLWLGVNW